MQTPVETPVETIARLPNGAAIAERRRAERLRLSGERVNGAGARIVDVSPFGCQIESAAATDYRTGQFIEIDFGNDVVTRAIVRWSDAGRAGVEFTRPLTNAQVNHVVAEASAPQVRCL